MSKLINSKKLIILILSLVLAFFVYELMRRRVGGFAGFYPFAESWTIKKPIDDVELHLNKLHEANPELFRDTTALNLIYDPIGSWREVYFYYADRCDVVRVRFRHSESNKNNTVIILVSFNNKKNGILRLMNRDFSFLANQKEKRTFENRVLKHLGYK